MLFTLLTLIIHNTKLYLHCSYKRYQITMNNCPSLSCVTYFSVGTMLLNSNNCEGVNPVVSLMNTKLNYICEVYVLLWARHVLCVLVHKDKEIAEVRPIASVLDGV